MSTVPPATQPQQQTSPATQSQQSRAAEAEASEASSGNGTKDALMSSDFETFLKMLTTQLQNQDPLNPMEATDFAVQLATFSSVEQQVKSNDLLESIQGQLGQQSMAQLAGWVGMEAKVQAPVRFDGSPITMEPKPHAAADRTELVVYDKNGVEAGRHQITPSSDPIEWNGLQTSGLPYPAGTYSFKLESYSKAELLSETNVSVYAEIVEARAGDGNTELVLDGGTTLTAEEITALRKPPEPLAVPAQTTP